MSTGITLPHQVQVTALEYSAACTHTQGWETHDWKT
jgi:hypothetical protein